MRIRRAAAPFLATLVALAISSVVGTSDGAAEELGSSAPSYDAWEDDLFGESEEPFLDDPDPSWGDEDPGREGEEEGFAPLFPPLSPWDLEEPGYEEPVFAEPDDLEAT